MAVTDVVDLEAQESSDTLRCTYDATRAADAWCTTCGAPFAAAALSIRVDGRVICSTCVESSSDRVLLHASSEIDPALRKGWRTLLVEQLVRPEKVHTPRRFPLRSNHIIPGMLASLAGLLFFTAWTMSTRGAEILEVLRQSEELVDLPEEQLSALPYSVALIVGLLRTGLGGWTFHLGLRIVGAPKSHRSDHFRAWYLSALALVLCAIPVAGYPISVAVWTVCLANYIRVRYDLTLARTMTAMLPMILFTLSIDGQLLATLAMD